MTQARTIACIAAVPVAYLGLCLGIEFAKWAKIALMVKQARREG